MRASSRCDEQSVAGGDVMRENIVLTASRREWSRLTHTTFAVVFSIFAGTASCASGGAPGTGGQGGLPGHVIGPVCASGQMVCGSSCADTNTDPNNCGDCETVCSSGQC